MIQQRNKYITKNIYFIQEKSVDINKTVKCKIFSEVLLIDGTYNGIFTLYRICSLKQFSKTFNSNFILI